MCRTKTCVQNITGFNNQLEWSPPQAHQIKIWLRLALNQSQNVKIKFVFTFPLRKQHNNNWTHRLNSQRAIEMCFFSPTWAWNLHYVIASLVFGRLQFMWNTNIHDLILAYQIHQKKEKRKKKKEILAHQLPICHEVKDLLYPQKISILNQSLMMDDRTIIIYTISWFVRIFFISFLILRGGGIYHNNYIYIYIYFFFSQSTFVGIAFSGSIYFEVG